MLGEKASYWTGDRQGGGWHGVWKGGTTVSPVRPQYSAEGAECQPAARGGTQGACLPPQSSRWRRVRSAPSRMASPSPKRMPMRPASTGSGAPLIMMSRTSDR